MSSVNTCWKIVFQQTFLCPPWKEITVSVETQRSWVGKVECTAPTMRNPWGSSSPDYTLLEGRLPKPSLGGFAIMPYSWDKSTKCTFQWSQVGSMRGFISASQVGRGAMARLDGLICGSTHSSQILIWCPGLLISKCLNSCFTLRCWAITQKR